MTGKRLLEIIDKNVDEKQLAKDLGAELILPFVKEKLGKLDIIPGTDIDNKVIAQVIEFLEKQVLDQPEPVQA
jgi:hypothetical protein